MRAPTTMLTLGLLTAACASTQTHPNYRYAANDPATLVAVDVRPGAMTSGESFSGSFHSEQIGDVFLEQTGDLVVGQYAYNRASCRATGHIEGRVEGNLMHFSWTESQRLCGRIAPMTGHGYMLFWIDSAQNGRANGEWGFAENEGGGGPWSLFRDRVRRQPTPEEGGTRGDNPFSADGNAGR